MGHEHHHHDHRGEDHALRFALVLTGGFTVVEAVGGWLTGSLALLADAGHMASDVGALGLALFVARIAARPPDRRQTMGYQRAEVLGAVVNGGAVGVLALWIASEAVARFAAPRAILAGPMMGVAAVGLVVNLVVAWRLHGSEDLNRRAAFLHVLGDLLGSVGALVAGALVWAFGWTLADPVASLLISVILLVGSARVLRDASRVLMQAVPDDVDLDGLERAIRGVPGVADIHDLHVWSLRPGENVVTVHVVLCPDAGPQATCAAVREAIAALLPTAHVTVQPEPEHDACASVAASG